MAFKPTSKAARQPQSSDHGESAKNLLADKKQTSKVKVIVRVRPPLTEDAKVCVETSDSKVEIFNHRNIKETLQYEFSSVFDKTSTQQDIFSTSIRPLLEHAINGENVSIFAYGPTGAGKTYTMLGTEKDPGMIPRVVRTLFQSLHTPQGKPCEKHMVTFSFLEIYNEKVQDLLNPKETDLPIREDSSHNIFVAGLTEKLIGSYREFSLLFGPASNNRTVAATKLNDHSSRSHSIVQLKVDTWKDNKVFHGKIYLIDLAGSEDNRRTGNSGVRLKESGAINKSLFVLGEVVDAINNGLTRIPYRNSKLTRLLQDSVGGTCHSVMITNISPEESFYFDTYCTLNFASKSRRVINNNLPSISDVQPPSEKPRALKRSKSASDFGPVRNKQVKLITSTSHSSLNPSVTDTVSSLRLAKGQHEHLEGTTRGHKQQAESLLLQRHSQPAHECQELTALKDLQHELRAVKSQLQQLQQQQLLVRQHETSNASTTPGQPHKMHCKPVARVPPIDKIILKDLTNTLSLEETTSHEERKTESTLSCSVLFSPSPVLFKKGFKSTASASSRQRQDCVTPSKIRKSLGEFQHQQQKQNEEFLEILNTAPVKRLQELHTVGTKRARLIFEWRLKNGPFTSFGDLSMIPGFTDRYVQSLLQGTASDDRSKWSEKPHQFQMTGAMSQTSGCSWTLAVHISMNWLCGQGLTPEN
ncbi:hypothetical protein C0Q70_08578 [Pomacea canaliculata]|uniref:Kinesin-like protein n=1 Tax=Pomacea canaliculata TaxID=400727 RepID=A0A2T7PI87_POMCA|nr:hypothetical protein C0Q70_08578 [Pomacea canaliculata]